MPLQPYGPRDDAALAEACAVHNSALAVDAPWDRPRTVYRHRMFVRYGWDGEPAVPFLLRTRGGQVVGIADLQVSRWENPLAGWATLVIAPEPRTPRRTRTWSPSTHGSATGR